MTTMNGFGIRAPKPIRLAKTCGWAASLSILVLAGTLLVGFRNHELASATREISAIDVVLAETSSRAFSNVAMVLDRIVEDVGTEQIRTEPELRPRLSGFDIHECLKMRGAGIARFTTVLVIDAKGDLVTHSKRWPTPEINVADRDYFQHARDTDSTEPYLSVPVQNKVTGRWVLHLSRRFSAKDGSFAGVIVGAVDQDYFQSLYDRMKLPEGYSVALWRKDGTLLARSPSGVEVGKIYETQALRIVKLGRTSGTYEAAPASDGEHRLVAVHTASDFPVFVTAGVTMSAALADWRNVMLIVGIAAAMALIATLAISIAAVRRFKLYEELDAALRARDESDAQVRQLQKLDALGQLTSGIAHDFNNMLSIVKGNIDLMRRRMEQGRRDVSPYLDAADEGVLRAADLTRRLLSFSRREPQRAEPVEPNTFVATLADLCRRTLGNRTELRTDLGWSVPYVKVDPSQLENAVLNLAINARDAMPDGGTVLVRTRKVEGSETGIAGVDPKAEFALVEVEDSGTGMPPEILSKVFEPFFTTKPVGKGTGLGLSQVFAFAENSGGRVVVRSEVGRGTVVGIFLPMTEERPSSIVLEGPAPRAAKGERVLVVDDEEAVRSISCDMLRQLGYTVLTASGGEEALSILRGDEPINLVITDIGMPGMGGARFAEEAQLLRPGLRILYATGSGHALPIPANDVQPVVLSKPYSSGDLARTVRAVLVA